MDDGRTTWIVQRNEKTIVFFKTNEKYNNCCHVMIVQDIYHFQTMNIDNIVYKEILTI